VWTSQVAPVRHAPFTRASTSRDWDILRRCRGAARAGSPNAVPRVERSLLPAVSYEPDRAEKAAGNHGPGTQGQKQ
jgi:hypothetical protein